jgi:hypothetical protein
VAGGGNAGAFRIHASGVFCDDFAFDVRGSLYCGTDPFNTLLRIAPAGSVQTLPTAVDGLGGPTAAFNHQGERRWVGETRSQQAGMGSEDTEGGLRLGFGRPSPWPTTRNR